LRDLRFVTAGLSLESAAEACGVDVRTFRRWETDNRAPLAVQKLLSFLSGELMHLDPQFKGFRLRDGKLFHDQAPYGVTLGDIRAMRWILAERDELRLTVKRLESFAALDAAALESPAQVSIQPAIKKSLITQCDEATFTHATPNTRRLRVCSGNQQSLLQSHLRPIPSSESSPVGAPILRQYPYYESALLRPKSCL